jgi:hypothetical protein
MSTRSLIAVQRGEEFDSIYCHNDGYPSGVGRKLFNYYQDLAKIDQLIALGDISSLGAEIGTKHDFNRPPDDVVNAYGRDRGEKDIEARHAKSLKELFQHADGSDCEYVYLFKDGAWNVTGHGQFRAFGDGPGKDDEPSPWRSLALFKEVRHAQVD